MLPWAEVLEKAKPSKFSFLWNNAMDITKAIFIVPHKIFYIHFYDVLYETLLRLFHFL